MINARVHFKNSSSTVLLEFKSIPNVGDLIQYFESLDTHSELKSTEYEIVGIMHTATNTGLTEVNLLTVPSTKFKNYNA